MLPEYITEVKQLLQNINESNLDEINEYLKLIETHDLKQEYKNNLIKYRNQVNEYKKQMLFSNNQKKIKKINTIDILKNSLNTLQETEQVGTNTLDNLQSQTDTIKSSIKRTQEINQNTQHSNKLTTKMSSWWR
jgi:hypothetical protein